MPLSATVRWGKRRRFVLIAALTLAAAALALMLVLDTAPAPATSGGDPYTVPEVTDTNADPNVVETTIVADETSVDIGNGVTAHAQTFNGTIPGPTFRLKVGDTVIVHYENHLNRPSAIHWHGIELANGMDGTPFTQNQAEPGGNFLYKFKVTRPGIFWYHPHHHASTNQVFKGLYGMILVTDPNEAALQNSGTLPGPDQTRPIVLSDTTVCKAPGSNDPATYPPSAPHVTGASPFPAQAPPTPTTLCETTATTTPINENGNPRGNFQAGDIPNIQTAATGGRTNEGQTVLTNGKNVGARAGTPTSPGALAAGAQQLDVKAGQGLRLPILNASAIRYMRLKLTTDGGLPVPLVRVGGEGGLLSNSVVEGNVLPIPPGTFDTQFVQGEVVVPPGSRVDIVAAIPSDATGTLTMWTEDYQRTGQGMGYPNTATVPVMHLHVNGTQTPAYTIADGAPLRSATGNPVATLPAATGNLLDPAGFTPPKTGLPAQNVKLTQGANQLSVDTFFGTHDVIGDYSDAAHLGSTRYAKEGDVLELTVENTTGARHPFHLHGFSIQPLKLTKTAGGGPDFTWPYREFRDNVDIPPLYTLTFRIKLDPRNMPDATTAGGALGRWVFHCHIFFHATNGMLGELVVVPANNGNERPDVNVEGAQVEVSQGQTATVHGTYSDRDSDPVTLSASVGTVTDTGSGEYTWTYPTGGDSSRIVYITATDSGGRKGQIPFQLKIDNTAPQLLLPGAQSFSAGSSPTFGISATDPDQPDAIALGASGLPAGLSLHDNGDRTGTVSGTVTAPPGNYVATFTANDGKHAPVAGTLNITITAAVNALSAIVDRPERLSKGAITVGCLLATPSLKSCRADVLAGGKRVGRATKTVAGTGERQALVRVKLNSATRRKIARSVPGLPVQVRVFAVKVGATTPLTARKNTRVVGARVVSTPRFAAFGAGSAKPTSRARTFLAAVAKQVGSAKQVVCTGFPDSNGDRALGKQRGAAACALLRVRGLKAKFKSAGSSRARPRTLSLAILR
jgi:FtsP/CotA-like multicopper oxidase with cupredoxin domain